MKKDEIARLLKRYASARIANKDIYFDTNEIVALLDDLEENLDYHLFEEILDLGLKLHPDDVSLQVKKCQHLILLQEFDEALLLSEKLTGSREVEIDCMKIECLYMKGEYKRALSFLEERLISEDKNYTEALFEETAIMLNDMELEEEADIFIKKALAIFPDNMILLLEFSHILEAKEDYTQAIGIMDKLIDLSPYSYENWLSLGRLCSFAGNYEKAIEAFDFALTCDDSDPDLKLLKAYCLYMNKNYQKAIEVYSELLFNEMHSPQARVHIAECHYKMQEYETAYQQLQQLTNSKEIWNEPSIHILYFHCCSKTERHEEAFKVVKKALSLFPENINLLSLLADDYSSKGNDRQAEEISKKIYNLLEDTDVLQGNTDNPSDGIHYIFNRYDYNKAVEHLEEVYAAHPENTYVNIVMALFYMASGDKEKFAYYYSKTTREDMLRFIKETKLNAELLKQINTFLDEPDSPLIKKLANNYVNNKRNSN